MKELSIEEKASRYDEAIEKAKSKIKDDKDHVLYEEDITAIFPELKESEDERIRKRLIKLLKKNDEQHYAKEIAWLEKQSKASKVEETMREIEEKAKAFTEAHKGETSEEILAQMKGELKHAAWSEEDERDFDTVYGIIYNSCNAEDASRLIAWLKAIKDRVQPQPQQQWSEEDEAIWAEISDLLWEGYKQSSSKFSWDDIRNWVNPKLKSLKDRYTWKPSDEKLVALRVAIGDEQGSDCCDILRSLLKDLSNRFKAQKGE